MTSCCSSTVVKYINGDHYSYTLTTYNNKFKICCIHNLESVLMSLYNSKFDYKAGYNNLFDIINNIIVKIYKGEKIYLHNNYTLSKTHYKNEINNREITVIIKNIEINDSNDIKEYLNLYEKFINMCKEYNSLENDYNDLDNLYDELEYNFYNSEKERKQLQINNNMLILSNRILKKAYNKVKHENVILLENSKPEYDYQEIKKEIKN